MTNLRRILIIDDEANVVSGLTRMLGERFDIIGAQSGEEALDRLISDGPFAVVISDMRMPGMDGVEVLNRFREAAPDTVRMMLTGNADQKTAIEAINRGSIFRFFNKPVTMAVLSDGIEAGLRHYDLITAERVLLEETVSGSIAMLSDVLSMVAPDIFQASRRLRNWAAAVARHMHLAEPWVLELAAELVHLGAIAVPPEVLARQQTSQQLSPVEAEMIAAIPEQGANLIRKVPRLEAVADAVALQSKLIRGEHLDGSSSLAGRILSVLLALDQAGAGSVSREAFLLLDKMPGRFDSTMLPAVRNSLMDMEFASQDSVQVRIDVPSSGVRPHDILETDLLLDNGRLVLAAGQVVTEALFLRLQNIHRVSKFQEPVKVRRLVRKKDPA